MRLAGFPFEQNIMNISPLNSKGSGLRWEGSYSKVAPLPRLFLCIFKYFKRNCQRAGSENIIFPKLDIWEFIDCSTNEIGTGGGIRTHDQKIKSLLLYQLSYAGTI